MATTEMNCLASGGGTLNPTLQEYESVVRVSGTMKQYTVDVSKTYILTACFKTSDAVYRTDVCLIHNGTLEHMVDPVPSTGLTITMSGNVVTVSGINASGYYNDLTLIQLD